MEPVRKYSRKRAAILECVRSTDRHPSADWIFNQLKPEIPDLSLGTVYRNLAMFRNEGIVQSLGVVNGLERFDRNTAPHCHLICDCCGSVVDVMNVELSEAFCQEAAASFGGTITSWNLQFTGLCPTCKREKQN